MPEGAHDWFRPKLVSLMAQAEQAGFGRDVAVAVITDLVNGALETIPPAAPDENWNRDIGEPDSAVNGAPTLDPAKGPANYGELTPNPLNHVIQHHWTSRSV